MNDSASQVAQSSDHLSRRTTGLGKKCRCWGIVVGVLVVVLIATAIWCGLFGVSRPKGPRANSGPSRQSPLVQRKCPVTEPIAQQATLSTADSESRRTRQKELLDPRSDHWITEDFSGKAGAQLKRMGKVMHNLAETASQDLSQLLEERFSCGLLRPDDLSAVYQDATLTVSQAPEMTAGEQQEMVGPHRGLEGFHDALTGLLGPMKDVHIKFKLFRVQPSEFWVDTNVFYEAHGQSPQGAVQQNATWQCRWKKTVAGHPPRLISIRVDDFEEILVRKNHSTLFADVTESAMGANPSFREQLVHGVDYWRERVERQQYRVFGINGRQGIAVGDVNSDGLEDLYVCQQGALPNRLFVQQSDGSVRDVSAEAGVDLLDFSRAALFVDLDNDGDQDLVISTLTHIALMEGDGKGHFRQRGELQVGPAAAHSMAAADYDNDGFLDIYVCQYYSYTAGNQSSVFPTPIPFYDAQNGGQNSLFRNEGSWNFREVTQQVGLDEKGRRWSFSASWEDFDNDGDVDLYVANDFGNNNLYRNDDGTFCEISAESGTEDANFGMSVSWGDYNRDGWMDLHVANMFSAAGNRVTFQPEFKGDVSQEKRAVFQRMARGNTLLMNQGDGTFRDVSETAGVTMGRWAWGSLFMDINNDGWEDLLVVNGYMTQENEDDL